MNKKFKTLAVAGSTAAMLAAGVASALPASAVDGNLVANGTFEDHAPMPLTDGYINVPAGQDYLTGWTVTGGGVDIVDTNLWAAKEGDASIDLNGLGAGSISKVITTVPGQTYNVAFYMSGNPDVEQGLKTMDVSATDNLSETKTVDTTGTTKATMVWVPQTYSFVAKGTSTTLTFASTTTTGPGFAGPVIDDVSVLAAPNVNKTRVWNTWTGGPVTNPAVDAEGWHPTMGDPQSPTHRVGEGGREVGVPYFVPGHGKSAGAWFLWTEV